MIKATACLKIAFIKLKKAMPKKKAKKKKR